MESGSGFSPSGPTAVARRKSGLGPPRMTNELETPMRLVNGIQAARSRLCQSRTRWIEAFQDRRNTFVGPVFSPVSGLTSGLSAWGGVCAGLLSDKISREERVDP